MSPSPRRPLRRARSRCWARSCCAAARRCRRSDRAAAAGAASGADVVAPNPNLVVQGIPPIPSEHRRRRSRATPTFAATRFVDWHPDAKRDAGLAPQGRRQHDADLSRRRRACREPEPLTDFADPVRVASYEPIARRRTSSSSAPAAATKRRRSIASTWRRAQITPPHRSRPASRDAGLAASLGRAALSVGAARPHGARAAAAARSRRRSRSIDPLQPGGGGAASPSCRAAAGRSARVVGRRARSRSRATSRRTSPRSGCSTSRAARSSRCCRLPGDKRGDAISPTVWKHDDSGLFVISDRGGEFRELMFLTPRRRQARRRSPGICRGTSSDVSSTRRPAARGRASNVAGKKELRFFDADSFDELPTPQPARRAASTRLAFHPRLPALAVTLDGSRSPATVAVLDPATATTQPLDARRSRRPASTRDVRRRSGSSRWPSFDGREISGLRQHAAGALHRQAAGARSTSTAAPRARRASASSAATTTSSRSSASP